jgi:dTMP kinase
MNKLAQGLFISIEGIDGAGKSTHVDFIRRYLEQHGLTVVVTREPGGTLFGEKIRDLLLHNQEPLHNITELLLMFASRQQLIHEVIAPNLRNGGCVLADRFVDASIAYQGGGRKLGVDKVQQLIDLLEPCLKTDLTLLFDVPLAVAKQRLTTNQKKDRIEREADIFFKRVQEAYYAIVAKEPRRVKLVKTDQSIAETEAQIRQHLDSLLSKR